MRATYYHDKRNKPIAHLFRELKRQELLDLKHGHEVLVLGDSGRMYRCRVTGKVKTWKRNAEIKVPIKYGLYQSMYGGWMSDPSVFTLYREVV